MGVPGSDDLGFRPATLCLVIHRGFGVQFWVFDATQHIKNIIMRGEGEEKILILDKGLDQILTTLHDAVGQKKLVVCKDGNKFALPVLFRKHCTAQREDTE